VKFIKKTVSCSTLCVSLISKSNGKTGIFYPSNFHSIVRLSSNILFKDLIEVKRPELESFGANQIVAIVLVASCFSEFSTNLKFALTTFFNNLSKLSFQTADDPFGFFRQNKGLINHPKKVLYAATMSIAGSPHFKEIPTHRNQ
jgi:hypothetical protein